MQKILILAALPNRLRLDREIREIEEAIKRAVKRDSFEIKIRTAVRPQDIRRAIAEERPQIVHFCGHGLEDGSLVLEGDGGNHLAVFPMGLAALFKLHTDYVKCVLLNACYSSQSAQVIGKHINYVIGMNQPIEDRAAIVFAQGFYDGLGYDNINNLDVIQRAFDEGIVAIQMENLLQDAIPSIWKLGIAQREIGSINRNDDESYNRNEQEAQKVQRQKAQLEHENNLCSDLLILCPHCKFKNPNTYKFCQKCGTTLIDLDNQRRLAELKKQEQRKPSSPISNSEDDLSSNRNVDYTRLRDLLAAGNWEDADIESKYLFLPEFVFIYQEDALPGGFLPQETEPLTFNSQRITPLLPLNPILLEYFTSEDLINKVKFQPRYGSEGSMVRVILDLPLSGLQDGKPPKNYRVYKDYPIKEENALPEVPILEVWPHFRAKGWHEYYAFYYDAEYKDETFQVGLPKTKEIEIFQEGRGSYQIARLEEFPSFISCQDRQGNLIGLILLQTPEETQLRGSWIVGVDFGSSFTNVYVNKSGVAQPLQLDNLLLKVTETQIDTRLPVLFEYFIPENFIPADKPLPLASVLTTRGSTKTRLDKLRPIFDGRIYIPDRNRFKPQENWMKTNLKWSTENLSFNQLFLKHLALHISALVVKNGIAAIQWSLSYPSAFSRGDRNRYVLVWKHLTKELEAKTGISHSCPDASDQDFFRTESLATAQYFRNQEGHSLVKTTCINMGDGTSDISIWEENSLVHQCSVQLAGRDLFFQFLEMNPQFLERRFKATLSDWKGLKGDAFNAKLDVLLRLEGDNWLRNIKPFVENEPDFQGLIRLTAIGTAGLYYYVGILLKVLYRERKYRREEITPVYIGGHGSRVLNWLAEGGQFNSNSEVNLLLSRMLSKGSEFEDTEVITRLSQSPEDEVACGLVLNETNLKELKRNTKDPLIAGEEYEINGEICDGESRLDFDEENIVLEIPRLIKIPQFLYDFHIALRELTIEGITPLANYTRSPDIDKNSKLWSNVKDELTILLLDMEWKSECIRFEPPFITGLKALLKVLLGKQWANK